MTASLIGVFAVAVPALAGYGVGRCYGGHDLAMIVAFTGAACGAFFLH